MKKIHSIAFHVTKCINSNIKVQHSSQFTVKTNFRPLRINSCKFGADRPCIYSTYTYTQFRVHRVTSSSTKNQKSCYLQLQKNKLILNRKISETENKPKAKKKKIRNSTTEKYGFIKITK